MISNQDTEKSLICQKIRVVYRMKCFADTGKGCSALTKKQCDDCSFFKIQKQVNQENKLVHERLRQIGRVKE